MVRTANGGLIFDTPMTAWVGYQIELRNQPNYFYVDDPLAAEIQFNAAYAYIEGLLLEGGSLGVELGLYTVEHPIEPLSFIQTYGQGPGTVVSCITNFNDNIFHIDCDVADIVQSVGIHNMRIFGNKANQASGRGIFNESEVVAGHPALDFDNHEHRFTDLIFDRCYDAGYEENDNVRNTIMDRCLLFGGEDIGLIQDGSNGKFNKIVGANNEGHNISVGGSDNQFNLIQSYFAGHNFSGGAIVNNDRHDMAIWHSNNSLTDYVGLDASGDGLHIEPGSGTLRMCELANIRVSHNCLGANVHGGLVIAGAWEGVTIAGLQSYDNTWGLRLEDTVDYIEATTMLFRNNSLGNIFQGGGIGANIDLAHYWEMV